MSDSLDLLIEASELLIAGKYEAAIEKFQQVLQYDDLDDESKCLIHYSIGLCYSIRRSKNDASDQFDAFDQCKRSRKAVENFQAACAVEKSSDIYWAANNWLIPHYYLLSRWEDCLSAKENIIPESLFQPDCDNKIKQSIKTILAILNITSWELQRIPIAHYTSPFVCEKLLGLDGNTPSPMRMNSSTYVNDPSEGKVLLDVLNLPELLLENKIDCSERKAFLPVFPVVSMI